MFRNIKTITKIKFIIFLIFISLFIISCDDNSSRYQIDPIDLDWNIFEINQVNYNSVVIKNQDSIKLDEQLVTKIIFYEIENFEYIVIDTLIPIYTIAEDGYFINFEFNKDVKLSKLYFDFAIRFYFENGSFVEIEKNHLMLKYPYKSAKVLFNVNEIALSSDEYFGLQDIDFNGNIIYYHPLASYGLYEYNLNGGDEKLLYDYCGGDFIAHDSNFIFIDICHTSISRYNIETSVVDLEFDLSSLDYTDINGMESCDGILYVIFIDNGNNYIAKFDYDGNYLASISYSEYGYCLTIDSGIAYSQNSENLTRFNLETETFLPQLARPIYMGEGIRIHDSKLFFISYDKNIIGYIPLSELK